MSYPETSAISCDPAVRCQLIYVKSMFPIKPRRFHSFASSNMDNNKGKQKQPIRVVAKTKAKRSKAQTRKRHRYISPLFDDRGFPHP